MQKCNGGVRPSRVRGSKLTGGVTVIGIRHDEVKITVIGGVG